MVSVIPMNTTTTIDVPDTECALVTSDNMDLQFTFPNLERQEDLATILFPN